MKVKDLYWEETNSITLNDPIMPEQPLRGSTCLTATGVYLTIGIKNHGQLTISPEAAANIANAIGLRWMWWENGQEGTISIRPNIYGNNVTIKTPTGTLLDLDQSADLAQWLQAVSDGNWRPHNGYTPRQAETTERSTR